MVVPRVSLLAALALALALGACHGPEQGDKPGHEHDEDGVENNFGVVEDEGIEGCDNLLEECVYPYPSEAYVVRGADGQPVGLRLPGEPFAGDTPIDPGPIGKNRGFGAASPILFQLPGAVVPGPGPFDPSDSLLDDARVVLVDAETGVRIPHWIETDYLSPDLDPPLFVIRPSVPLPRGTQIVVGVRGLVDEGGAPVPAPEAFAALRDKTASRWLGVHARRSQFEAVVFPALAAAGVARDELQLAWSFPVQAPFDATHPLLSVRDAVLAALPPEGPQYTIDAITVCEGEPLPEGCHPSIRAIVDGTVDVPSAVGPGDAIGLRNLRWDGNGNAVIEGVERWPFRLQLPHVAFDGPGPVPVLQYGHGFLGTAGEANNGWLRDMADRLGFAILACDMQGMSEPIVPVWAEVLANAPGRFPELQELAMQGVVNQLVQQRLVKTSLAEDPDPRLRRSDGQLAWDPATVWYTGNSQGGSVGTLVMGISVDVQRGVLGVPGSGYPLLLHRSTVFSPFGSLIALTNPARDALPALLALIGTGWDNSDPLTFSPHLHGDPLPGTPDHEVLFHVAKEDQQVVNEASFISGRAAGATLMVPAVRPVWGLPEKAYPASPGAALVEVDFGVPDDPTPLDPADGDPSMPDEGDTHGWLRKWPPAQDQLIHFLRTGEVIDVCGGQPCVTGPQ